MPWESAATKSSCCVLSQVGLSGKKVPWTTWAAAAVALTGRGSSLRLFGSSLTLCHSLLYPDAWARSEKVGKISTPLALCGASYVVWQSLSRVSA